jgi:hypothetical protein
MSNNIEFFRPQCDKLALGSAVASIYLDGEFCDFLVPQSITFAGEPEFNQAILNIYVDSLFRGYDKDLWCGQKIVIKTVYDCGIGIACPDELVIFSGFIEQIEIAELSKIVAKDYSCKLKRKAVYGQNMRREDGQLIFIESADTVFNPSGKGNLAKDEILFAAGEDAKSFTCADAIYYLLSNYIPAGELAIPSLDELKSLTNNCGITDIDVTGLNLIEAIQRCCKQTGLRFKFVPIESTEAIVFYRPGAGREVEINCQHFGERLDVSKTNISEITRRKNTSITNRYVVQGDYKIFEATFNLVKGWDTSLEANDYDRYSPTTNENFNAVRDVYRKWVLNEAGDYSGSPYNQGQAFDFSKIFQTQKYLQKKRRFLPALTCGEDGESIGYNLEVSYTNGSKWWPYMSSFKVLLDQCGIWLSVEQLDTNLWFAIVKGVLKVRITACVMADERISYTAADGPVNSIIEVADKIITLPKRFKYQKVSPQSIFVNGRANQIDDTKSIVEYANNLCGASAAVNENLQIKTMTLTPYFSPGDRITSSSDSRDALEVKYDTRNICCIEKVHVDYESQQTIITAVKRRK